jgi:hypothetical protein
MLSSILLLIVFPNFIFSNFNRPDIQEVNVVVFTIIYTKDLDGRWQIINQEFLVSLNLHLLSLKRML